MKTLQVCIIAFLATLWGFLIGFICALPTLHFNEPVPLSNAEKSGWHNQRLTPMEIRLVIRSAENFKADARAIAKGNIEAYALPYDSPCSIFIPDDWVIQFNAAHARSGNFTRADNSNTLAHEILHCIRGQWHD